MAFKQAEYLTNKKHYFQVYPLQIQAVKKSSSNLWFKYLDSQMLHGVFPFLWRTKLRDKVFTWTKFALTVLNNLLLPHCSRNKNRRNSLSSELELLPTFWNESAEEHKHSTWLLTITLLQIQSIDTIACTEKLSSWTSAQLDYVNTLFSISSICGWMYCIYYKYNFTERHSKAVTPMVCIHHFKLSRPLALDLYVSK